MNKISEIIYGDSIEVMKNMAHNSVDLIVTDPPFKMTKRGKSCRPNYMRNNMGDNLFEGNLPNTKEWIQHCFNV